MNPADIEQAVRLESIFMPHATRQRAEAFERQKDQEADKPAEFLRVVHYTTAEAAIKILRTKRLWMRNATCMDDYREVQHGAEILARYFNKERTEAFAAVVDEVAPGMAMDAINKFNGWWNNHLPFNIFVSSLSEHFASEDVHGRLSMWRAFGANSTRVALVIKIPKYTGAGQALGLMFSPVAYLTEEQVNVSIAELLQNVAREKAYLKTLDPSIINGYVFLSLLAGVACLKHEGFWEEREWRAVYAPQIQSSPLMKADVDVVRGVPQHIYKIPLDKTVSAEIAPLDIAALLDRVIIGPTPFPWVIYQAFAEEMKKVGIADADSRIFSSRIPMRSAS